MHRRPALLLSVLLALALAGPPGAAARPVAVELSATGGAPLGRLAGVEAGRVAYFPLDDVARLAGGTLRGPGPPDRMALVVRKKTAELRRGRADVLVGGRPVRLSAPVRVERGVWLVPGDLLVRVLPALLGTGVRVARSPDLPRPTHRAVTVATTPARPPVAPVALRDAPAPAPEPARSRPAALVRPAPPTAPADPEEGPVERAGPVALRYRSYPTLTRVVIEGDRALEPRLVESEGGALVVALPGLRRPVPRAVRAVRDGLVETLELTELRGAPALRVTFERAPAGRKVYRLPDPPRVVLELHRAVTPGGAAPRTAPVGIRTIVLDPGHGGHDVGAVGPGGLQEKDLTLDLARRVAALLQEETGARVVLSRTRDAFLALRERTQLANREKADLFVSIHVNAAPAMAATGTETYFLSSEATDNAAREAAAYENRVIELEPGPRTGARDVLRTILWDLAQSDFQQESSRLAEALQTQLDRALRLPSRGVKQAPFYVLGGAAMPAVLVEVGFLSNPTEEQRLRDDGYRDRIARALAEGIAGYKRHYERRAGAVARR